MNMQWGVSRAPFVLWLRTTAAAVVMLAVSAAGASAATITFASPLGPEAVGATGSGDVTVTYDDVARTLAISATFSGLSGTTTVAHIHCCTGTPGTGTIGVAVTPGTLPLFPAGVSNGAYSTTLDLTQAGTYTGGFLTAGGGTPAGAEAALLAGMLAGRAYFNVHSSTFGGGEIRGFLQQVPEPASLVLLGLAGVAGAWRRRRGQAA